MINVLIFGDIVAKIGRHALAKELPNLKRKYTPDLVIANGENLAHGKGMTSKTLDELKAVGVDLFTGGNHTFSKPEGAALLASDAALIRPANYSLGTSGQGFRILPLGDTKLLVINLQGQVFMKEEVSSPFTCFDSIVNLPEHRDIPLCLVDFHGETTSERNAFKWHVNGRATLVWGTHTHVQTNDAAIAESGMGYITDVGMTGARDGVIGIAKEGSLDHFVHGSRLVHEFYEHGPAIISGLYAQLDPHTSMCAKLEHFIITTTI